MLANRVLHTTPHPLIPRNKYGAGSSRGEGNVYLEGLGAPLTQSPRDSRELFTRE